MGTMTSKLILNSADGVAIEAATDTAAPGTRRGAVLLVHGITVDMDEGGGMFVRLADQLTAAGFDVMRFSFRGHGGSGGSSCGVTIAGECLDLQTAFDAIRTRFGGPLSVVAASFGAVPTALSLPWLSHDVHRLVLWNPVLDLRRTFLEPELPWGQDNFGRHQLEELAKTGSLAVDGSFDLGRVLFLEFTVHDPFEVFVNSQVRTLVVHGDQDTAVSYEVATDAVAKRPGTQLHTVVGSDHGFDSRAREDEAITVTVDWLTVEHDGHL